MENIIKTLCFINFSFRVIPISLSCYVKPYENKLSISIVLVSLIELKAVPYIASNYIRFIVNRLLLFLFFN